MATVHRYSFEMAGSDGGPLRGEVRTAEPGGGRPAVIVCHGFKGFKDWGFFPHLADRLARAGLTSVTFNFSGSGVDGESFSEPERFGHATHSGDLDDLSIVVDALRAGRLASPVAPVSKTGLFGHSRGGGTAVLFAGRETGVAALVTWAAIATVRRWSDEVIAQWRRNGQIEIVNARTGEVLPLYTDLLDDIERHGADRLDIVAAAVRIQMPWLIVHGEEDESVPVSDGVRLHQAAPADHAELVLVSGGSHGFGGKHPWAGSTPQLDEAMDRTVSWFTRWLL